MIRSATSRTVWCAPPPTARRRIAPPAAQPLLLVRRGRIAAAAVLMLLAAVPHGISAFSSIHPTPSSSSSPPKTASPFFRFRTLKKERPGGVGGRSATSTTTTLGAERRGDVEESAVPGGRRHDDDDDQLKQQQQESRERRTLIGAPTGDASRRDFLRTTTSTATGLAAGVAVRGPRQVLAAAAEEGAEAASASMISTQTETIPPPSLVLPPIGLGAWSWGDSLFWGYDKKNDDQLKLVFDYAVDATSSRNTTLLLDTAEVYGFGRSEQLIGQFAKSEKQGTIQVATKFAALPIRTGSNDVVKACKDSLKRLNMPCIDLYQIHFPNAWSNAAYWDGLAECYDRGLVKAVGVSNYGVDAVRACHDALSKRGIQLSTNQIQYSLLYRYPETDNGLLKACNDLGVQVLSYSPLALGMLAGGYTREKPPQGPRKALYEKLMTTDDYQNLLNVMRDVAAVHPNATPAQVALNWCRAKGTVPIPGARTLKQVSSNYGSLDWIMSDAEVKALDVAASKVTTFNTPDMLPFPKEDVQTHLKMFDS